MSADVRCKDDGSVLPLVPPYDVTLHATADLDVTNTDSIRNTQVCVDLPAGLGKACVSLGEIADIIAAAG
jgi:hypothetical protein